MNKFNIIYTPELPYNSNLKNYEATLIAIEPIKERVVQIQINETKEIRLARLYECTTLSGQVLSKHLLDKLPRMK